MLSAQRARDRLIAEAQRMLDQYRDGRLLSTRESEHIDFKEEAGRRGPNGRIEPGSSENQVAATKLADEVACMANTPGGGLLVVGVSDRGEVIGTELDIEWLRKRINSAVSVAPHIEEYFTLGQRVLLIYTGQAPEPVEDTGNRLRWRVGDTCESVDRAAWWEHREEAREFDQFAQKSNSTLEQVRPGALEFVRRFSGGEATETDQQILRRIGALRADNFLTAAGELLFTSAGRTFVEFTALDVLGGSVLNRVEPAAEYSLLEQIERVEQALEAYNGFTTLQSGFVHQQVREVPTEAVREAILNGLIHRDWTRAEATDIRWIDLDSRLTVRSPGGFVPGIDEENVLSNRATRYPALADLFRALGLVEKQGLGVDRMYQAMIVLGHNPPKVREVGGPYVECSLTGGEPLLPVVRLAESITPSARKRDVGVALVVYALLRQPFLTTGGVAHLLQAGIEEARIALKAAEQTTAGGRPLIQQYKKDVFVFGAGALEILEPLAQEWSSQLMTYRNKSDDALEDIIRYSLDELGEVRTTEVVDFSGASRSKVKRFLDRFVDDGVLRVVGAGRSARYVEKENS